MIWWIPLIGAAIGALAYEDDPWTGALIGAGIGMTGGAAAGAAGMGGAAAGAAGTAGAGMGAAGAGLTAGTGTGLTMAGASGGLGLTAGTGAGLSLAAPSAAAGGVGLLAPAAASTGYGLVGAAGAGTGFMTQAKPWLDAGASMVQQSGLLNPQPQGGPQHQPLPQYQGSDIGNQISSQGGDMLQANAMRREENKRRREMQNPFAFGRF